MKIWPRVLAAVLVGLLAGQAHAYTNPACTTAMSCSYTACEGSFSGTTTWYACDCQNATHGGSRDSDCVVGSDSNAGTSAAAPFQTFDKLRSKFAAAAAGDRFLMCRGGVFTEANGGNSFVNHNSTALNPVVVTAYMAPWASGDEVKPIVNVPTGQNGIDMNEGADTVEHGYHFSEFTLVGSGGDTTVSNSDAFFLYNQIYDGQICGMVVKWFSLGVDNSGGNNSTDLNNNWTIRDNDFSGNSGQGILGANNGYVIANNRAINNGFGNGTFNHNMYLVDGDTVLVVGNELYQSTLTSSSGGKCDGASLVIHGVNSNWTLRGNYIHEDVGVTTGSCYGMQIVPGYTSAETNASFVIDGNYVLNVASNGINLAATHGGDIRNNVVVMTEFISAGISATNDSVVTAQGDWQNQDIIIQGNTVDLVNAGVGIAMVDTMARGIVRDNVVYLQQAAGTGYCFKYDQSTGSYSAIDYNACYRSTGGTLNWESSTGDTFAAWKTATSFDTHSINATNPLFTNVGTLDFSLQSGSPLRDVGTTGPTGDFIGTSRPQNGTTDIGAFEYIVSVTVTAGKGSVGLFGGF